MEEEIIESLSNYRARNGQGLINIHRRAGCVIGYTYGGNRERRHYIPGTKIQTRTPFMPYAKSKDELPQHELSALLDHFKKWVKEQPWYSPSITVRVADDPDFNRAEYRIIKKN